MPVIRASQLPATAQVFSMNDVEKAAKSVLLKAKLQAEQLIAAAIKESEQLKEQARQEGSREGFDHGHAEGARHGAEAGRQQALQQHSAELTALVGTLRQSLEQIDAHRLSIETDGTTEVVKLAIAIARRIIKKQAAVDTQVLEANLGEAMKLAVGAADLRIVVHPQQRAALNEALPRLKLKWPGLKHVELVDDPSMSPGGCRVCTKCGEIDADLNAQLDRVVAELIPDASGVGAMGGSGEEVAADHSGSSHATTPSLPCATATSTGGTT